MDAKKGEQEQVGVSQNMNKNTNRIFFLYFVMLLFMFVFLNCIAQPKFQNTKKNEVFLGGVVECRSQEGACGWHAAAALVLQKHTADGAGQRPSCLRCLVCTVYGTICI